jgi:hypothetical protein
VANEIPKIRKREFEWQEPSVDRAQIASMSGLEYLRSLMQSGRGVPIGALMLARLCAWLFGAYHAQSRCRLHNAGAEGQLRAGAAHQHRDGDVRRQSHLCRRSYRHG